MLDNMYDGYLVVPDPETGSTAILRFRDRAVIANVRDTESAHRMIDGWAA